jgi:hypothetical protein
VKLDLNAVDDDPILRSVALDCQRQVQMYGTNKGFSEGDLVHRCPRFRRLTYDQRFRVQVLMLQVPTMSSTVGSRGAFRFYPRPLAPAGAFNIRNVRTAGAVLLRAADKG